MMRRWLGLLLAVVLGGLAGAPQTRAAGSDSTDSLPIPRFVSMKFNLTNIRVGPGKRYPVGWVFQRRTQPVEIIQTFDVWRKIRDWEGTEGWVVEQAVSGTRTFIVTGEIRTLHNAPDVTAGLVARLEPGVIGKLEKCPTSSPEWCRVNAGGYDGWLQRADIWGVESKEFVD